MNFEFEEHLEAFYFTPALSLHLGQCECCDEPAGVALSLHWLFWGINIVFAFGGPHE